MTRIVPVTAVAMLTGFATVPATAEAESPGWSRFRGPGGQGVVDRLEVPSDFNAGNFRWNTALPGTGHSSPVIRGSRVFVTCQDPERPRRSITCVDAGSGAILWSTWMPCEPYHIHGDNSFAAATPAADGDAVYLTWVTGGKVEVLALDHDGRELWRRELGAFRATHGPGASLVVVDDTVIVANDQESADAALHGLDRKSGATRWKVPRRSGRPSYATPARFRDSGGRDRLLVASPAHGLTCLDPATGRQDWAVEDLFTLNVVASPVLGEGLALATAGRGGSREAAVVSFGGDRPARLAYRPQCELPYVPTPVVVGGHAFLWTDRGEVACIELADGRTAWEERVTGPTYSSPVSDGSRILGISRKGEVVVIAAAPEFRVLGRCQLPEGTHATPAIADGDLFIRTFGRLIRVGP